jgi:predicted enzyme related to lactoylglutathione lyase
MAVELKTFVKGVFCWADLNTTDPLGARKFYQDLFGWEVQEFPMPDGNGTYAMCSLGGKNVGGIAPLGEDARKMGAPPHWLNYIATDDVDAAARKVQELGGKIFAGPMTFEGMGRMAVVADPTGGVFALWKSANADSGEFGLGEPGHACWQELTTTDIEVAKAFYTKLFDYTLDPMPMAEGSTYYVIKTTDLEKPMEAGMMPNPPEMKDNPSAWGLYFAVTDCDATARKAVDLGGKILHGPENIPNIGRFAVLQDPQGAVFSILKGEPQS